MSDLVGLYTLKWMKLLGGAGFKLIQPLSSLSSPGAWGSVIRHMIADEREVQTVLKANQESVSGRGRRVLSINPLLMNNRHIEIKGSPWF